MSRWNLLLLVVLVAAPGCATQACPEPSASWSRLSAKPGARAEVFMLGELERPGALPWHSGLTLSRAIAQAGGIRPIAWSVVLTRSEPDGSTKRLRLSLHDLRTCAGELPLQAGDVVHVATSD